jgi:HEAT repeat protein
MINDIKKILKNSSCVFEKFEILEHYAKFSNSADDVKFLLEILKTDQDPIVRHEVSAQLLRIEMFYSNISIDLRDEIVKSLIDRVENDSSVIVVHECLEALGYIASKNEIQFLKDIINTNTNCDIVSTAFIALKALELRVNYNLEPGQFWDDIYNKWKLK